jgi:hypothetical protein
MPTGSDRGAVDAVRRPSVAAEGDPAEIAVLGRQRVLIGATLILLPLNLLLFFTETFPFNVIAAAHHAVGLRYSGLVLAAIVALLLLQLAAVGLAARLVATVMQARRAVRPASEPGSKQDWPAPGHLWLAHHDVYARVLELPQDGGVGHEISRAQAPRLDSGYYVGLPGGFAGVFDSARGPIFFLDERRIALDDSVRCRVIPGRRRSVFQLWRKDRLALELSYAPPEDIDIGDAFSSRFDRDFFVWLAESHDTRLSSSSSTPNPAPET